MHIIFGSRSPIGILCAGLLLVAAGMQPCLADDATPAPAESTEDAAQVMMLGDVKVTGQKEIVKTLQAIKTALKQPLSTDKAHENDVVCRIGSETGARARQYLLCATNKQLTHMRFMVQTEALEDEARVQKDEPPLARLTAHQSASLHEFRMPVNAQAFEHLLQSIPDARPADEQLPAGGSVIKPVPAVSTQAVPASATGPVQT